MRDLLKSQMYIASLDDQSAIDWIDHWLTAFLYYKSKCPHCGEYK